MFFTEVINGLTNGKRFKRILEHGGFEQLSPIFPLVMCHVRYTVVNREGDFVEWSDVALDVLLDPHSGFAIEGWEEV